MTEREELIRFGCMTPEQADQMIANRDKKLAEAKAKETESKNQTTEQP